MSELWVVTAHDEDLGTHLVGVFEDFEVAEEIAINVSEPWAIVVERAEVGMVAPLPDMA